MSRVKSGVVTHARHRLKDLVDSYLLLKCHGLQLWSGTGGTAPSTVAHIVAARKLLQDAKLSGDYMGVISTTTEASHQGIKQGDSRPQHRHPYQGAHQVGQQTNSCSGGDRPQLAPQYAA